MRAYKKAANGAFRKTDPQTPLTIKIVTAKDGQPHSLSEVTGRDYVFNIGPSDKPIPVRVFVHLHNKMQVVTHYATGYRICDVDMALALHKRGQLPTDLEAAKESFDNLIRKVGPERFQKRIATLEVINK